MGEQNNREWLSALTDDAIAAWPDGQRLDDADVQHWHAQHLTGCALRGDALCDPASTSRLLSAVRQAYGPTTDQLGVDTSKPEPLRRWWQTAANDAHGAWPWAAAVVLAVGMWVAWPQGQSNEPVLAQAQTQPVLTGGVLRDLQLDALLQSHRQWGAGSALQFPAGYVRNVALER